MKLRKSNRYILLAMGALVQFCYGIAYIWSVFQPHAKVKFSIDTAAANLPFGILLGLFTIGNLVGGYLQKKINVTLIIMAGSVVMCLGLLGTAYVPVDKPWLLNITFGVIAGFGCGCAYNTLLSTIQRWFPDKRGMVTGIIVCAAGLFGLVMNPIANYMIEHSGFSGAMIAVAAILLVICLSCGWVIKNPPEGYMEDYQSNNKRITGKQYRTRDMLKTKQYYIIAITFMFAVLAYFLINPMLMSLGVERGLSTNMALVGVMIVSVMNTAGRLLAPWISDRVGRKRILLLLFALNMSAILFLAVSTGFVFLTLISCVAISYGGFMGMYPTISADYFGSENAGMNYGVVMIGYAISSIGCPYLVKAVNITSMGTAYSFLIAGGASLVGLILMIQLKKPV